MVCSAPVRLVRRSLAAAEKHDGPTPAFRPGSGAERIAQPQRTGARSASIDRTAAVAGIGVPWAGEADREQHAGKNQEQQGSRAK